MKKLFSSVILAATLIVSSVANAGLITGTNWDEDTQITEGQFYTSGGASVWNEFTTEILLDLPRVTGGQTDDFADLFSGVFNLFYASSSLSTSGGEFSLGGHSALGSAFIPVNISFVGNYVVDVFNNDLFRTTGTGILTYGNGQSTQLDFWNEGSSSGQSASVSTLFRISSSQGNNPGDVNVVPEPSTLAIFALGVIGLVRRKLV